MDSRRLQVWSYLVCFFLIFDQGHCLLIEVTYEGSSETGESTATIESPHFPQSYIINSTVYVYYIRNNDPARGYVQLVFTDFALHDTSSFKIYDGWNTSAASFVYGGKQTPVFQSSSAILSLVFKTGALRLNERHGSNIGFRAVYKFVKYPRREWDTHIMPSTGFCPEVSKVRGLLIVAGMSAEYTYHCVWQLKPSFQWRIYILDIYNTSLPVGGHLKIHSGLSSAAPLVMHLVQDENGLQEIDSNRRKRVVHPIVLTHDNYYIVLQARMTSKHAVYMAFTDTIHSAASIASHVEWSTTPEFIKNAPVFTTNSACPFKSAMKSLAKCMMYWESEEDDGSCDYYHLQKSCSRCQCSLSNKCYGSYDICDSFNDCGDMTSESDCSHYGERWDFWRVLMLFLAMAAIIFLLRDMYKNRERLYNSCKNCQCSRLCVKNLWARMWKDSAVAFYLKKLGCCAKCGEIELETDRTSTDTHPTSPNQTPCIQLVSRHHAAYMSTPVIFAMGMPPPQYTECEDISHRVAEGVALPPPSYEESIAVSNVQPVVHQEPPPEYGQVGSTELRNSTI